MGLVFLVLLLLALVWMNKGVFGFGGSGCSWMSADKADENGQMKWMCQTHGTVIVTDGERPADCR